MASTSPCGVECTLSCYEMDSTFFCVDLNVEQAETSSGWWPWFFFTIPIILVAVALAIYIFAETRTSRPPPPMMTVGSIQSINIADLMNFGTDDAEDSWLIALEEGVQTLDTADHHPPTTTDVENEEAVTDLKAAAQHDEEILYGENWD